jgi:drug/metabolite transporter (DMT)-like permease
VLAIALAIGAAFSWGISSILVRFALRDISVGQGTLVSLVSSVVGLGVLVLIAQPGELFSVSLEAIVLFAIIGTFNFPLGRYLNFLSMGQIGVGRSTPIIASSPLFAMALAVAFTGESLGPATIAGTALLLAGLWVTISAQGKGKAA